MNAFHQVFLSMNHPGTLHGKESVYRGPPSKKQAQTWHLEEQNIGFAANKSTGFEIRKVRLRKAYVARPPRPSDPLEEGK